MGKTKILKQGDKCRRCGTSVVRKDRNPNKKLKQGQEYYFRYFLQCPNCRDIYMVEDAKVYVKKEEKPIPVDLFSTIIPAGKLGAEVIAENGQKGIIHRGQTNENGDHYVYPYKNEFEPKIEEFKIISYF